MNCNNSRTAVILVTFNKWELTKACLQDLKSQIQDPEHFVFAIADNCSTDATVENLRKEFPQVHVFPQTKNLGFGAANNAAIRGLVEQGISFDRICLLNNDTRLSPNALGELVRSFDCIQEHLGAAVVVPSLNGNDGLPQNNFFAGFGFDGVGAKQFLLNAFRSTQGAAKYLEGSPTNVESATLAKQSVFASEVHWASAVCWMVPRSLWNKTGGFDERIFMYNEDADLALRIRKAGGRFIMANNVVITHLGGGSAQSSLSQATQHDKSQEYVFRKHFGIRGLLLSKSFRILRSSFRICISLPRIFNASKRQYIKHHLILLKDAIL